MQSDKTYYYKIIVTNSEGNKTKTGSSITDRLGSCNIDVSDLSKWTTSKRVNITKTGKGTLQYKIVSLYDSTKNEDWTSYSDEKTIDWDSTIDKPTYLYCRVKDGTNIKDGSESIIITNIDTIEPKLSLSKETYIEGFNGWTFDNASVDSNNVLTLAPTGTSGIATSGYYNIDGEAWSITLDGYTTSTTSYSSSINKTEGGVLINMSYYDSSYQLAAGNSGYDNNGWGPQIELNKWQNVGSISSGEFNPTLHGQNTKYLKIIIFVGNEYSQPITKVRNLKVYGQMPNSFYLINIESSDNIGITTTKYAKGEQTKDYFKTNGQVVTNNQIRVTENGTYTVYVSDASGNEKIQTIVVNKIT